MHHLSFILSFVHGPLGGFHVLASVNHAAVNTVVHRSFPVSDCIFFRLLNHMVVLLFIIFPMSEREAL